MFQFVGSLCICKYCVFFILHNYSGSLQTHATTPLPMLTTPQYPVYQEGNYFCFCCIVGVYITASIDSTKKILGVSTLSRALHSIAQTRELACTKVVVPEVISRGLLLYE